MTHTDDHIQHVWNLTHPDGNELTIELWTDDYTVRVHGGPDDGEDDDRGRKAVDELLARYTAAGWRTDSEYAVNDLCNPDDEPVQGPDLDSRPDECPQCGSRAFEYVPNHVTDLREGEAWLCGGPACAWGRYVTA